MPLSIIRADITKQAVDAIVNPANSTLLGGGGADGAIHAAAGPELLKFCKTLGGCEVGHSKISPGFDLPSQYIIHTVGPVWQGGRSGEEIQLKACYKSALELALENNIESIAFPLISSGIYGYPKDKALQVALATIGEFLLIHEMTVFITVFDKKAYQLSNKIFSAVQSYIDDNYVDENYYSRGYRSVKELYKQSEMMMPSEFEAELETDFLYFLESTFSEHILMLIDYKNKNDTEVYKKANLDRRLFSKIRSDKNYKPSKATALALCIGLELNIEESRNLLEKAGYALSKSHLFDVIIEYFIKKKSYDILMINSVLFEYNQPQLGTL